MARTLLVADPGLGMSPAQLVSAWDAEFGRTPSGGRAAVERGSGRLMVPGVLELVVLPVAVNVASSALLAMAGRLVNRARGHEPDQPLPEVEIVETTNAEGDRVLVVRARQPH